MIRLYLGVLGSGILASVAQAAEVAGAASPEVGSTVTTIAAVAGATTLGWQFVTVLQRFAVVAEALKARSDAGTPVVVIEHRVNGLPELAAAISSQARATTEQREHPLPRETGP